jgi:hypothetical protein
MAPDMNTIVSCCMDGTLRLWMREFQTTVSDPIPKPVYR